MATRRIFSFQIYDLDSEVQTAIVPVSGILPYGVAVHHSASQLLWSTSTSLMLVDGMAP